MYRNTFVKIDNTILQTNVEKIISKYNDYKYYIGVVKGNAYGHGSYIVNSLIKGGVNYLAVSSLEEAIEIRKYNKEIPILCLEPINLKYMNEVIKYNVTITIDSLKYLKELNKVDLENKINVHLKLDTGMNRLGIKDIQELEDSIKKIRSNSLLFLEGLYTHLATSGTNDKFYDRQIDKFKELTKNIDLKKIPIVHLNRSITLSRHSKLSIETGTRLGIIMYGFENNLKYPTGLRKIKSEIIHKIYNISPVNYTKSLNLETAFSLYTSILNIKHVKAGEFVGYGAKYIAKKNMLVAVLPIGYADGITAEMKYVSINSKRYNIIGDICMDMTIIEVDERVKINDTVELFGKDITVREIANRIGTNAYHVFTNITTRVPRIYTDGKEIKY